MLTAEFVAYQNINRFLMNADLYLQGNHQYHQMSKISFYHVINKFI